MSDAASSPKRLVVVVGRCGSGKSSLIKRLVEASNSGDTPAVSNSSRPVTVKTTSYKVNGIELVDTIGTDVAAVVPLHFVEGHHVHFIVLLSSFRWEAEKDEVMKNIGWTDARLGVNVSVYVAHFLDREKMDEPPPLVPDLMSVEALRFQLVPKRSQTGLSAPMPSGSASTIQQPTGSSSSTAVTTSSKKVQAPHTLQKQWFGKLGGPAALGGPFLLLHDCWQGMGWTLPTQRPMKQSDWLQIDSQSDVIAMRQGGEKLLEFHLHVMYPTAPGLVQSLVDNEHLKAVAVKFHLKEHIEHLYVHRSPEHPISQEKYADYIEALFFKLWATPINAAGAAKRAKVKRACIVAFLKAVCGTE